LVNASLYLTAVALLLCLIFVGHTTGGTLFLFSTLSPALVAVSIAMVAVAIFLEYRQAHKLFMIERYAPGQMVFRQGEVGECAYFIREGQVEVIDEDGDVVLATLGPGEHFGEMALLGDAPRNAAVRAASAVELASLGKENFLNMMKLVPTTEEAILTAVRERAMRGRAGGTE
jgi:CRP-like cAMP-binding protein